jgi:diguanylate cyclase (GGDEF)-like protein
MNTLSNDRATLLLLLSDRECRGKLTSFLSDQYRTISGEDADALAQPFDLCIVDAGTLSRLEQQILIRKEKDAPFLPFLLVTTRADLQKLATHIKYTVDEILLKPVDNLILQPRVETLLNTRQLVQEIQLLADFDELTKALTRHRFFKQARRELVRSQRFGRPLSVVMLDIDFFKNVNDSHGHVVGDQVLQEVARRCLENIREIDIFGRYGGEEFALILPESDLTEAQDVAERLRLAIAKSPFCTNRGDLSITISLGVVSLTPEATDIEFILDRADQALYIAKRSGRNQVTKI